MWTNLIKSWENHIGMDCGVAQRRTERVRGEHRTGGSNLQRTDRWIVSMVFIGKSSHVAII